MRSSICAECGKEFEATNKNSVDMKILGLYATVCKQCYLDLKKAGKIHIIKKGALI